MAGQILSPFEFSAWLWEKELPNQPAQRRNQQRLSGFSGSYKGVMYVKEERKALQSSPGGE